MNLIRPLFLIIAFSIIACGVNAQKRGNVWCFGDSAGIDFSNLGLPQVFSSSLDTRGLVHQLLIQVDSYYFMLKRMVI
ncbi:MAG: hypothetical protein IPN54_03175 [Bacteroidetes bacterium]|nr:hypothetical protein [Bacteroidota bacterium]